MQTDTEGRAAGRTDRQTNTTELKVVVCNFVNAIMSVYSEIHRKAQKHTMWTESRIFERKSGGTYSNRWAEG